MHRKEKMGKRVEMGDDLNGGLEIRGESLYTWHRSLFGNFSKYSPGVAEYNFYWFLSSKHTFRWEKCMGEWMDKLLKARGKNIGRKSGTIFLLDILHLPPTNRRLNPPPPFRSRLGCPRCQDRPCMYRSSTTFRRTFNVCVSC